MIHHMIYNSNIAVSEILLHSSHNLTNYSQILFLQAVRYQQQTGVHQGRERRVGK